MDIKSSNQAMLRGAAIPAVIVAAVMVVIFTLTSGSSGAVGALLATFTVLIFFSVSLLVGLVTKDADPIGTMALAMLSYFTKLLLMAGLLIAVTRLSAPESVDRRAFGLSALAITLAWLTGEVRAFFRLRLQLPLPQVDDESNPKSD
jgi:hypothetical protein